MKIRTIREDTRTSTFIGGEELHNGALFGDICIPLDSPDLPGIRERLKGMEARKHATIFVAFHDSTAEELEPLRADRVLEEILEFIEDRVFPAFERLI